MNVEMFFERFAEFADAPDAVAKMRELILHLAVHGKLANQSASDGSASELLQRSRAEMAKRMAARQAKREKPAAPVSDEEKSFALPSGWVWCRLVDAGQFINGVAFKPSDWGAVGRPIIRIQNLSGRNLEYNRTTGQYDSSVVVQNGDILVSWSATLDAFVWRGEEGVLNQHIFRVLPAPLADKNFLFWLLKWVIRELALSDHAHGLVMSHINRGPFLARPIPLPPLAEQKRIAAKVDELMALCDQLEAQQKEREQKHAVLARASLTQFAAAPTPANLEFIFHKSYDITPADLRKAILSLAVQGDVLGGRSDNSDWQAVTMKEVCELITDGEHATPQRIASGVPLATAKNVRDGFLDMSHTDFVAPETAAKCWRRCRPKHGDILMVCVGATTGRVCLVENPPDMVLVRSVALLRPATKRIEATFLELFLRSPSGQSQIWAGVRQNAQPCLYLGKMSEFAIDLPPLAEQRRIVAKAAQLMALVDALEAQLSASRITASNLLEAVMSELTNGAFAA